jgi:hypothetical protein
MKILIVALALAGCGWTNMNLAPGPPAYTSPVRPADVAAWSGAPRLDLETHPFFSTLPRVVTALSDGRELWSYRNSVCTNQFFVRDQAVESYRLIGNCMTNCSLRPESRQCGQGDLNAEAQAAQATAATEERSRTFARIAVGFGSTDDATRERAGLNPLTADEHRQHDLAEQRQLDERRHQEDERRHQQELDEVRRRKVELTCTPYLGQVRCVSE